MIYIKNLCYTPLENKYLFIKYYDIHGIKGIKKNIFCKYIGLYKMKSKKLIKDINIFDHDIVCKYLTIITWYSN